MFRTNKQKDIYQTCEKAWGLLMRQLHENQEILKLLGNDEQAIDARHRVQKKMQQHLPLIGEEIAYSNAIRLKETYEQQSHQRFEDHSRQLISQLSSVASVLEKITQNKSTLTESDIHALLSGANNPATNSQAAALLKTITHPVNELNRQSVNESKLSN